MQKARVEHSFDWPSLFVILFADSAHLLQVHATVSIPRSRNREGVLGYPWKLQQLLFVFVVRRTTAAYVLIDTAAAPARVKQQNLNHNVFFFFFFRY